MPKSNQEGSQIYGKLFASMYDGTLGTRGPWQALVTFQQLIVLADKHGDVDMTAEAIARRTTIPLEIILEGLRALGEPDPESRSPDLEGRRIVLLNPDRPWGWRVVNYQHYRKIRSQDERREYMRSYQRKRRSVNQNVNMSTMSTTCEQSQPIAVSSKQEAEAIEPPLAPPSRRKGNGEPRDRKKSATRVPDSFEITEPMWAWAQEQGVQHERIEKETEKFLDHHKAKGSLFSDWPAAWRKWMRNAVEFAARPH